MFNFKLPTPDELREFQIEHYTALMNNAKSFEQKIFLRKQLYNLRHENNNNPVYHFSGSRGALVQEEHYGLRR